MRTESNLLKLIMLLAIFVTTEACREKKSSPARSLPAPSGDGTGTGNSDDAECQAAKLTDAEQILDGSNLQLTAADLEIRGVSVEVVTYSKSLKTINFLIASASEDVIPNFFEFVVEDDNGRRLEAVSSALVSEFELIDSSGEMLGENLVLIKTRACALATYFTGSGNNCSDWAEASAMKSKDSTANFTDEEEKKLRDLFRGIQQLQNAAADAIRNKKSDFSAYLEKLEQLKKQGTISLAEDSLRIPLRVYTEHNSLMAELWRRPSNMTGLIAAQNKVNPNTTGTSLGLTNSSGDDCAIKEPTQAELDAANARVEQLKKENEELKNSSGDDDTALNEKVAALEKEKEELTKSLEEQKEKAESGSPERVTELETQIATINQELSNVQAQAAVAGEIKRSEKKILVFWDHARDKAEGSRIDENIRTSSDFRAESNLYTADLTDYNPFDDSVMFADVDQTVFKLPRNILLPNVASMLGKEAYVPQITLNQRERFFDPLFTEGEGADMKFKYGIEKVSGADRVKLLTGDYKSPSVLLIDPINKYEGQAVIDAGYKDVVNEPKELLILPSKMVSYKKRCLESDLSFGQCALGDVGSDEDAPYGQNMPYSSGKQHIVIESLSSGLGLNLIKVGGNCLTYNKIENEDELKVSISPVACSTENESKQSFAIQTVAENTDSNVFGDKKFVFTVEEEKFCLEIATEKDGDKIKKDSIVANKCSSSEAKQQFYLQDIMTTELEDSNTLGLSFAAITPDASKVTDPDFISGVALMVTGAVTIMVGGYFFVQAIRGRGFDFMTTYTAVGDIPAANRSAVNLDLKDVDFKRFGFMSYKKNLAAEKVKLSDGTTKVIVTDDGGKKFIAAYDDNVSVDTIRRDALKGNISNSGQKLESGRLKTAIEGSTKSRWGGAGRWGAGIGGFAMIAGGIAITVLGNMNVHNTRQEYGGNRHGTSATLQLTGSNLEDTIKSDFENLADLLKSNALDQGSLLAKFQELLEKGNSN